MSGKNWIVGLAALTVLVCAGVAEAGVYEQPLDTIDGKYSNRPYSAADNHQVVADQFMLPTFGEISTVRWYGFYETEFDPGVSVDFTISFFADNSGLPALDPTYDETVSAQVLPNMGPSFLGTEIYEFEAAIPIMSVSAGQTMWLSVAEADLGTPPEFPTQWLWSHSTVGEPGLAYRVSPEEAWNPDLGSLAFSLQYAIPEPSAFLTWGGLVGLGLIGGWRRRRRCGL